jgi:hypothetical protein
MAASQDDLGGATVELVAARVYLEEWMRKKNVHSSNMTDNSLAWAIVKNIFEGGIMPRPFINYDPNDDPAKVLPFLDKMVDAWMDDVFNKIIQEIDKYFT